MLVVGDSGHRWRVVRSAQEVVDEYLELAAGASLMTSSGNATSISILRWSAMSSSWLPAYDVIMTEVVRHKERFGDALRDLPPPTHDDVTILLDGTRLDTREKTLAWIKELIARRAEAESSG